MSATETEIGSQPEKWRAALRLLPQVRDQLPAPGQRVAIIGCGTSLFIAQAVAAAREVAGLGETDAFAASEMPTDRTYDLTIAISRSGTTTEVAQALAELDGHPSLVVSALAESPVVNAARHAVLLDFADEDSIVQTRFATTTLALFRAHFGHDIEAAIADAEANLARPLPVDPTEFERFVFLGQSWTIGLASEAALKCREAAGAWTEAYPGMEYRHGPMSVTGPSTLVWFLGEAEPRLVEDVRATGATVIVNRHDAMAELVLIQRMAVALAQARGLDPDRPANLSRSVVLP